MAALWVSCQRGAVVGFAIDRDVQLVFVRLCQQTDRQMVDPCFELRIKMARISEDLEQHIKTVIASNAVDIDLAATTAQMNQHDVTSSGAAIFIKAVMLEGQADWLHTAMTG